MTKEPRKEKDSLEYMMFGKQYPISSWSEPGQDEGQTGKSSSFWLTKIYFQEYNLKKKSILCPIMGKIPFIH